VLLRKDVSTHRHRGVRSPQPGLTVVFGRTPLSAPAIVSATFGGRQTQSPRTVPGHPPHGIRVRRRAEQTTLVPARNVPSGGASWCGPS